MDQASLPFAGIRVLDIASFIAAPVAATIFADYGADVIKVEPPTGDGVRRMGWLPPDGSDSYIWKLLGRNKRSVVLDLKTDAGREAFLNPGFDGFECHLVTKLNQSGGFTQGEEAGRLSMAWST